MIHRTFDRRSKQLEAELAAFQREVEEMERRAAPAILITHSRRDGNFLHVTVLAAVRAQAARVTSNSVEQWNGW
jgi:hypothetical protein